MPKQYNNCIEGCFMRSLILASDSPRRRNILSSMGIAFSTAKSSFVEVAHKNKKPIHYVIENALGKAQAVAKQYRNAIIIGADTVVVYRGRIIGKPHTYKEAISILRMLQGKTHVVYTGLSVLDTGLNKVVIDYVKTRVTMRALKIKEIKLYLNKINPLDKAGAYAIQEHGSLIIEKISGCYYNVVGLPVAKLEEMLLTLGVTLFDYMKI